MDLPHEPQVVEAMVSKMSEVEASVDGAKPSKALGPKAHLESRDGMFSSPSSFLPEIEDETLRWLAAGFSNLVVEAVGRMLPPCDASEAEMGIWSALQATATLQAIDEALADAEIHDVEEEVDALDARIGIHAQQVGECFVQPHGLIPRTPRRGSEAGRGEVCFEENLPESLIDVQVREGEYEFQMGPPDDDWPAVKGTVT